MIYSVKLPKASFRLAVEHGRVKSATMGAWMVGKEWTECQTWLLARGAKIKRYEKTV